MDYISTNFSVVGSTAQAIFLLWDEDTDTETDATESPSHTMAIAAGMSNYYKRPRGVCA